MIKPLKGKKHFSDVFKHGIGFYEKPLKAIVCIKANPCFEINCDDYDTVFLGVAVSKRTAKKAVVRNRIKRLLRESVRHVVRERGNQSMMDLQSIILLWYYAPPKPSQISLKDVLPVVNKMFDRISDHLNKNQTVRS
jgi:ribonuclease P protein component